MKLFVAVLAGVILMAIPAMAGKGNNDRGWSGRDKGRHEHNYRDHDRHRDKHHGKKGHHHKGPKGGGNSEPVDPPAPEPAAPAAAERSSDRTDRVLCNARHWDASCRVRSGRPHKSLLKAFLSDLREAFR